MDTLSAPSDFSPHVTPTRENRVIEESQDSEQPILPPTVRKQGKGKPKGKLPAPKPKQHPRANAPGPPHQGGDNLHLEAIMLESITYYGCFFSTLPGCSRSSSASGQTSEAGEADLFGRQSTARPATHHLVTPYLGRLGHAHPHPHLFQGSLQAGWRGNDGRRTQNL